MKLPIFKKKHRLSLVFQETLKKRPKKTTRIDTGK